MEIKKLHDGNLQITFKHKIIFFVNNIPVAYTSKDINSPITCKESLSRNVTVKVRQWIKTLDKTDCIPIIYDLNPAIDQDVRNDFNI